jgi:BirA family biotin operon repressor/biotin-[acetyl-CoA-carboxylase] ligase
MHLIKIHTTGSTNDDLKKLIRQTDVAPFTCIWAIHQNKGRGQMGNTWESESGKNLTFSFLLRFSMMSIQQQFELNKLVALTLLEFLSGYYPHFKIKWANDIMADNRKIAGILIENILKGYYITHAVIGIGINVNQTDFQHLPNATSLKNVTGSIFDLETLLREFLQLMNEKIEKFNEIDFNKIHVNYLENLFGFQEKRIFTLPNNSTIQGKIINVNPKGKLVIQTQDMKIHAFGLQEIKFEY